MPPNLGGFFMVRSYYPSECHADYFDFERIEALKPAIEAGGISTLSQPPPLGLHKQKDHRPTPSAARQSHRRHGVEQPGTPAAGSLPRARPPPPARAEAHPQPERQPP